MNRKNFIQLAAFGTTNALFNKNPISLSKSRKKLIAKDVQDYLRSLIEVEEPSVDRIIIGDPNTEVTKIGTAWTPYWKTLKEANARGVNTLVVHEPTFYTHWDLDRKDLGADYYSSPSPAREEYFEQRDKKKAWIEDHNMVIIRCHDVLDKIPDWGIPYSFGKALGFKNEDIIRSKKFYNVYGIEKKPAIEVARYIASHVKKLSQPGVAFYGDANYMVSSVGLGTGAISNPMNYAELEADLHIAIDDSIRTWTQTPYAEDTGRPLVVLNHGTSEEPGAKALGRHLRDTFQDYEVIHFEQGCTYKWIE